MSAKGLIEEGKMKGKFHTQVFIIITLVSLFSGCSGGRRDHGY